MVGRTYGRSDGRSFGRTDGNSPLCSIGHRPLRFRCPKGEEEGQEEGEDKRKKKNHLAIVIGNVFVTQ